MLAFKIKYFISIDFLIRLIGTSSFTIFIALIYQMTGRSADIGFISLATFFPSLIATIYSGKLFKKFHAPVILKFALIARLILFAVACFFAKDTLGIFIVAGVHSLLHQILLVSKMSCDAQLIEESHRKKYLSVKMLFANLCIILGPPLGGVLASQFSISVVMMFLLFLSFINLVAFSIGKQYWFTDNLVGMTSLPMQSSSKENEVKVSFIDCFHYLRKIPFVLMVVVSYCVIAIILEIQAPLIFPFTKEVFGKGSDFASILLGAAGIGGIVGSLFPVKFPRIFQVTTLPYLILFDGMIFGTFTLSNSMIFSVILFLLLGIMGAVTLVLVETMVQAEIRSEFQPTIFSLMQFAGGAGGATIGVFVAFLADQIGSQMTLQAAAVMEIGIGVAGILSFIAYARERKKVGVLC